MARQAGRQRADKTELCVWAQFWKQPLAKMSKPWAERRDEALKILVDEGLKKVRSKPWAEPLGKALETNGKIFKVFGGFVPGAYLIGAALSIGATLLNPEPSMRDLQTEIKKESGEVKVNVERILKEVVHSNNTMTEQMTKLKDLISRTFQIVADIRYKVCMVSM